MNMYAYHYLWERLQQLENEIAKLKRGNKEMSDKISNIRPVHIDKIEYKIHELNIETLSGTLNVGLTANGEEMGEVIEKIVDMNRDTQIGVEESNQATDESSSVTPGNTPSD